MRQCGVNFVYMAEEKKDKKNIGAEKIIVKGARTHNLKNITTFIM